MSQGRRLAGTSRWRQQAVHVATEVMASLPHGASEHQARRALNERYPFGPREGHPYRVWCSVVREFLDGRFRPPGTNRYSHLAEPEFQLEPFGVPEMPGVRLVVACPWCGRDPEKFPAGCMVCGPLDLVVRRTVQEPVFQSLRRQYQEGDTVSLFVLRDWLHDRGIGVELESVLKHGNKKPRKNRSAT